MKRRDHAPTYYAATAINAPECPQLTDEIRADVCVVGAGYTGISTALNLAERGYSVVVLEDGGIGWGASGRNGGQICTGYAPSMRKIEGWVGADDARKLWAMSEEAKAIIRGRTKRHEIPCDLKPGYLLGAVKRKHLPELQAEVERLASRYDYNQARMMTRGEVEAIVATKAYHGAMFDAGGGHLHPLNYCLGLARAAIAAGVRVFENSRVVRIESGANPIAHTVLGAARARYLVLAGNAYLGDVAPPAMRGKVMPATTYVAATEPLEPARAHALIANDCAVSDTKFVLDYYRLSADQRLLFGGRVSYTTLPPPGLATAMRRSMLAIYPQLSDVKFEYVWGGNVAITVERTPHLGRISDNIYFAQGFSGMGVALTGMAGKVMAEAVAGTAERFDVFARLPHTTFLGGKLLRTPTLALAMAWFRLRDLL